MQRLKTRLRYGRQAALAEPSPADGGGRSAEPLSRSRAATGTSRATEGYCQRVRRNPLAMPAPGVNQAARLTAPRYSTSRNCGQE